MICVLEQQARRSREIYTSRRKFIHSLIHYFNMNQGLLHYRQIHQLSYQ